MQGRFLTSIPTHSQVVVVVEVVLSTPILMYDGTTKPIESVVLGDKIKRWTEQGQEIVEVEKLMSPRPTKVVNLVIANENGDTVAELGTTKDHPFKLVDGTWVL